MKKYRALRFVSGTLIIGGWLIIALVAITFFLMITRQQPAELGGGASFMVFLIAVGVALLGILVVAAGELIEAVADIAMNTAYLPAIAKDGASTVSFFEHMSGRSHREEPVRVKQ